MKTFIATVLLSLVAADADVRHHAVIQHGHGPAVVSSSFQPHLGAHGLHAAPIHAVHSLHAAPIHAVHPLHASPFRAVHPVHAAPIHAVHAAPFHSVHAAPIHAVHAAPFHSVHAAPIHAVHAAPFHAVHAAPLHPIHALHAVHPVHATPLIHHAAPVAVVHRPVVHAVHAAPAYHAEPAYDGPAEPYTFEYAVADDYSKAAFNAAESSDAAGNAAGSYSVALPDGRTQTVTYTANGYDGYVADVTYEGTAVYPEYVPNYPAAPGYHA